MNYDNIYKKKTTIIKDKKLVYKWEKLDKSGNTYLILKLEGRDFGSSGESLFVFSSKFKEERWDMLEEGVNYNFTCEEGNNGECNILIDVEKKD